MRHAAKAEPSDPPFWRRKSLAEMTRAEWESLCDGCGKCCQRSWDAQSGEISHTNVACRLLDVRTCRCTRYAERRRFVPNCEQLDRRTCGAFSGCRRAVPIACWRKVASCRGGTTCSRATANWCIGSARRCAAARCPSAGPVPGASHRYLGLTHKHYVADIDA